MNYTGSGGIWDFLKNMFTGLSGKNLVPIQKNVPKKKEKKKEVFKIQIKYAKKGDYPKIK